MSQPDESYWTQTHYPASLQKMSLVSNPEDKQKLNVFLCIKNIFFNAKKMTFGKGSENTLARESGSDGGMTLRFATRPPSPDY